MLRARSDLQSLLYTALSLADVHLPLEGEFVDRDTDWEDLSKTMEKWITKGAELCQGLPTIFQEFWDYVHTCHEIPTYTRWSQRFEEEALKCKPNIKELWTSATQAGQDR